MSDPVQVLIIEDSSTYREALEDVIDIHSQMHLLGSFGLAERGIRFIKKSKDKPDIILLDLQLPGMSGLEALPILRKEAEDAKVIVLTQSENEEHFLEAMGGGASSYLLKSTSSKQVINAILTTSQGNSLLDMASTKILANKIRSIKANHKDTSLSAREHQVLERLARGLPKKEISAELGISTSTIVSHTISIYHKLDATNAPSAVANAFAKGILKS